KRARSALRSSSSKRPSRPIDSISRSSIGRRASDRRTSDVRRFVVAALSSLIACGGSSSGKKLGPTPYSLAATGDGRTITLTRDQDTLLTFGPDAFQLGVVNKLDDNLSYDPFWLEAKDNALYVDPPADLRFVDVASASFASRGSFALDESYSSGVTT